MKTTPAKSAQHAVVYLVGCTSSHVLDTTIDDRNLSFAPHVSVMSAGGTLTYVNHHPFPDSAFSPSNERWDFGMVEAYGKRKRKFERTGVYTLLCHVHPSQVAFLVVAPSIHVARADKQGNYRIENVPPGSYELVCWAPRLKEERVTLVMSGADKEVGFALSR